MVSVQQTHASGVNFNLLHRSQKAPVITTKDLQKVKNWPLDSLRCIQGISSVN